MGRRERVEDRFRKRLRQEREHRGLSQAHLAKLLSRRGTVWHATTVAKIEAGDRQVRIDELALIADLFKLSADSLLGRQIGLEDDLAYNLRLVLETARRCSTQVDAARSEFSDALSELATVDFDGFDSFGADAVNAVQALTAAVAALERVAQFRLAPGTLRFRKERALEALIDVTTRDFLLEGPPNNDA